MHNIIIPQSNTNDDEVFIAEWKFKNNDLVKKGDHLFSIETSKVVEEIYSDNSGYLRIDQEKGSRVKVGSSIGYLSQKKTSDKINSKSAEIKQMIITKKAKNLISENKIDTKVFEGIDIVTEDSVKKYLTSLNHKETSKNPYQLIILLKNNNPYHACVFFESHGIIDLSLLGSKKYKVSEYNFNNCKCIFFSLNLESIDKAIKFYSKPALLTEKIIKKERSKRGWSQTAESADYILKFRNKRSINSDDMNCIEWLIRGLEINGLKIPNNILTASSLLTWAREELKLINEEDNLKIFHQLY